MDLLSSKRLATPTRALEVQKLLRTTVSMNGRDIITQYLNDAEHDIRTYEAEINQHKAAIMALESRRNNLKNMVEKYRSLLSPIHRLPQELLATIFTYCCQRNELVPDDAPPAIALGMVCGRWRELLLSAPSLWTSFSIDFSEWDADSDLLGRLVRIFVLRSRNLPLELWLEMSTITISPETTAIVHTLGETSPRWRFLQLSITTSRARALGLDRIRGNLPLLESLDLEVWVHNDPGFRAFNLFNNCPSLHSVSLYCQYDVYEHFGFPWSQIRSLQFRDTDSNEALSQMSLCSNLHSAELLCIGDTPHYERHIVDNNLRDLFVMVNRPEDVSAVYGALTLPRLSSMRLEGTNPRENAVRRSEWARWDERPLQDFMLRSSCPLTSLSLKWLKITDKQTISLLQLLPSLQSLTIEEYHQFRIIRDSDNRIITSALLDKFAIDYTVLSSPSTPRFLPHLTDLTLAMHPDTENRQALLNAVATRWLPDQEFAVEIGVDCLRSLKLELIEPEDADYESFGYLQCFRDVGMRTSISHIYVR
ncbi:hypothetical protein VNI00_010784 [Paramarasmius palmivorus]|uniref:F-box domain-containing protein n=1 Tax=Paramarasmius palmivorus TaxID=297713 RepID=A0AAW0CG93_9AGAR